MTTPVADKEILSLLGEAIHTGFRKGCDAPQAPVIWKAINDMPPKDWGRFLSYLLWSLRASGVTIKEEAA